MIQTLNGLRKPPRNGEAPLSLGRYRPAVELQRGGMSGFFDVKADAQQESQQEKCGG